MEIIKKTMLSSADQMIKEMSFEIMHKCLCGRGDVYGKNGNYLKDLNGNPIKECGHCLKDIQSHIDEDKYREMSIKQEKKKAISRFESSIPRLPDRENF